MKKTQRNVNCSMLIYIHFSFDFLGLDNIDIKHYLANELINTGRLLSHLKHCSRGLSDIKRSATASRFISDQALLRVL